jgi:hypothetical protein
VTDGQMALAPQPGDPAPWFHAATASNPRYDFSSVAGRYVVLAFLRPRANAASTLAMQALLAARAGGLLDDANAAFAVSIDPADAAEDGPRDALPGPRVFLEAARCRGKLEAETLTRFPGQADRAHLWLRTTQRTLGKSPWAHCTDERTLGECVRLLDVALPKGRRR